jgi:glyoxylase-like metal-dependent hydrolase (beta-lactamase superfamily II)
MTRTHSHTTAFPHALRRGVRALALAGAAAICGAIALPGSALAAAPMVKTQAPGYYRTMVGDFEITALFDGIIELDTKELLTNTKGVPVAKLLAANGFAGTKVPTSVTGYLINTGAKLVLVDTGAADKFGPTLGKLQANLKAAGYQPEQVDEILITHMHGDHVGGLVVDGKVAFPNATVHAGKPDADFWLSEATLKNAPEGMRGFVKAAQDSLNPYVQANKFAPIAADGEIVPGIKAIAAHGHTPGHTIYVVESKGDKLVLWGDLMHVAAVQFPQPQVTIMFDTDSPAALVQRRKAYADAAKGHYLVGSAHLPFPGLGRLRADGKGYTWVPINYQP